MKKFNRFITFALVCILMLGVISTGAGAVGGIIGNNPGIPASDDDPNDTNTAVPISAQVFDDVAPDAWYYEAVNTMAANGLLKGVGNNQFKPGDPITYGEFASILCRIGGLSTTHVDHYSGSLYCDSKHWAAGAIYNINKTSIFMRGCDKASEPLWRGEALTALVALAGQMSKYNYSYDTQISDKKWTLDDIPDAADVKNWNHGTHRWTKSQIVRAYNLGLTTGTDSKGTCNPTKVMTRAELCQMLYNMGISGPNCVTIMTGGIM